MIPNIDVTQVQGNQPVTQYMAVVSDLQVGHAELGSVFTNYGIQGCVNCDFKGSVIPFPERLQSIIPPPNVIFPF